MQGHNFQGNPYQQGPPFSPRDQSFRGQNRGQPRFHQQFVPHHSGRGFDPRTPSPRGPHRFQSPNMHSPSPNRSFSPRSYNDYNWNRRFSSGGRGSPSYRSTPRHGHGDSNPGGCDDISQYYNHNMVLDPWKFLKQASGTKTSSAAT